MFDFTKRRFLSLPYKTQHTQCAEILRILYTKWTAGENGEAEWELYCNLMQWLNEPIVDLPDPQLFADRYHVHLGKAQVSKKEHNLLPRIRKGDRPVSQDPWPIAIYLDHIRSAHNVGSILRTVEAFSLGSVYFSKDTPHPGQKQVKDTSMGASDWVDCRFSIELSSLPHPIIALETSDEAASLYQTIFPTSFTLVLGNEEYGCSNETLALADCLVAIPMRGHKNSLNVANAFAIAAGEICRQKSLK